MNRIRSLGFAFSAASLLLMTSVVSAQEAVGEEVSVEGAFVATAFEVRRDNVVHEIITRLAERAEAKRTAELEHANESAVTRLLELTSFIPIRLGNSGKAPDTFFLDNSMRADFNPRDHDVLSLWH